MTEFVEVDCSECGEPVETPKPICEECIPWMESPEEAAVERAIPESDLRELIEEWREDGRDWREHPKGDMANVGRGYTLEDCADELEQVLEE